MKSRFKPVPKPENIDLREVSRGFDMVKYQKWRVAQLCAEAEVSFRSSVAERYSVTADLVVEKSYSPRKNYDVNEAYVLARARRREQEEQLLAQAALRLDGQA